MEQAVKLTPQQKKAVVHKKGPLLIVAGPGTGKTAVITERIRHLIQDKKVSPSNILALTFTEKAAEEMLERLDVAMPLGYEEPWLSTFHAFCERILRENAVEIGLDPAYEILTEPEAWIFFRDHLNEFKFKYFKPLGNPTKFVQGILTLFSRAQDQDVEPEDYVAFAKALGSTKSEIRNSKKIPKPKSRIPNGEGKEEAEKQLELAQAYEKYSELKVENSKLDFGDLILWTLKLFRKRPSVLKHYREQFKEVLVDEFQDTNYAQYELIKLLAPPESKPNFIVVADDDQCIYKWRGACVSNIWQFRKDYPKPKTIVLDETFRLHSGIFQPVYQSIQNNDPDRLESKLKISKKLKTRGKGPKPEVILAQNAEEEAERVVQKIGELAETGDYNFSDFAILSRANSHLDPFVAALRRHGVPYQLVGNRGLFERDEIKELLAVLRVIGDPEDRISWYQLLTMDSWGIAAEKVLKPLRESEKKSAPLWDVLSAANFKVVELIKELQDLATEKPPSMIILEFIHRAGYARKLLKEESVEDHLKVKNINLFLEKVKLYETRAATPNIPDLVDWLDGLIEAGESPAQAEIEDVDTVNLLTIHAAKGLEFPVVFIVSLTSDRFPTRNRRDPLELPIDLFKETLPTGDAHIEEERRLFFVGCTRARDRLYLSLARNYGGVREKRPSPFISELDIDIKDQPVVKDRLDKIWYACPPSEKAVCETEIKSDFSHFSYSYFDEFKQCPLKFKFHYILRIPTPTARAQAFGQTMHRVLRDFHRLKEKDQALEDLLDLYERHWIPLGYDGVEDQKRAKREGEKIMRRYFKNHKKRFGEPAFLEKGFMLRIEDVLIKGFIDRVDRIGDGFEIVDYKTADKLPEQKDVDKNEQLTIYALAAKEALEIESASLALYFLKHDKKLTTTRTPEQLEAAKGKIVHMAEEIRASNFPAKPGILCHYCDFRRICPAFKLAPKIR